ncbi:MULTISPECIES: hypothetical protein [Sphingobium]|uniref:hypothetical protein n=1 Tax=Sphingobium TaxID=165695 RepID=UPI0011AEBE3E|nr:MULTISPECIES: hypothetical protein [Sphingobium]KAA9016632.1 hypothetical protein F4U94_10105 [Sphingobium limneticum]MBU0931475.1 hypothetical protein [Alphaproteobacteria bacterium]
MTEIYSVSYSSDLAEPYRDQLIAYLKNGKYIIDWNMPFDGLILLTSNLNSEEVAELFADFFANELPIFATKLVMHHNYGFLPEQSFEWFEEQKNKYWLSSFLSSES